MMIHPAQTVNVLRMVRYRKGRQILGGGERARVDTLCGRRFDTLSVDSRGHKVANERLSSDIIFMCTMIQTHKVFLFALDLMLSS